MPRQGLLGIESLTRREVEEILERARDFQPRPDENFRKFNNALEISRNFRKFPEISKIYVVKLVNIN